MYTLSNENLIWSYSEISLTDLIVTLVQLLVVPAPAVNARSLAGNHFSHKINVKFSWLRKISCLFYMNIKKIILEPNISKTALAWFFYRRCLFQLLWTRAAWLWMYLGSYAARRQRVRRASVMMTSQMPFLHPYRYTGGCQDSYLEMYQ